MYKEYFTAKLGEHITYTAERAHDAGESQFIHNKRILRVADYFTPPVRPEDLAVGQVWRHPRDKVLTRVVIGAGMGNAQIAEVKLGYSRIVRKSRHEIVEYFGGWELQK